MRHSAPSTTRGGRDAVCASGPPTVRCNGAPRRKSELHSAGYAPIWSSRCQALSPEDQISYHPDFVRILDQIPASQRGFFTVDQLAFLSRATRRPPAHHIVDYRASLPFFGRRFYLTIFFGRERRNLARLLAEGQLAIRKIHLIYSLAAVVIASATAVIAIIGLYLLKCMLGFDLIEGHSVLHEFVFGR